MRSALRQLWESRDPRERRVLALLVGLVSVALLATLMSSAQRARLPLRESITRLQQQSNRMAADAAVLERLRAAPATQQAAGDLRAVIKAQADAAGISAALLRNEAEGANRVKTACGPVSFSDWLIWVENLQAQKIRLDSSRIDTQGSPGMVSVTATFVRGAAQ